MPLGLGALRSEAFGVAPSMPLRLLLLIGEPVNFWGVCG
jgi:hypothetical protein